MKVLAVNSLGYNELWAKNKVKNKTIAQYTLSRLKTLIIRRIIANLS